MPSLLRPELDDEGSGDGVGDAPPVASVLPAVLVTALVVVVKDVVPGVASLRDEDEEEDCLQHSRQPVSPSTQPRKAR